MRWSLPSIRHAGRLRGDFPEDGEAALGSGRGFGWFQGRNRDWDLAAADCRRRARMRAPKAERTRRSDGFRPEPGADEGQGYSESTDSMGDPMGFQWRFGVAPAPIRRASEPDRLTALSAPLFGALNACPSPAVRRRQIPVPIPALKPARTPAQTPARPPHLPGNRPQASCIAD